MNYNCINLYLILLLVWLNLTINLIFKHGINHWGVDKYCSQRTYSMHLPLINTEVYFQRRYVRFENVES